LSNTMDTSSFICTKTFDEENVDCTEDFFGAENWSETIQEEAWFTLDDSRLREIVFFWNDTYTVAERDGERCFTDCWVEECNSEDISDCTYEVCYDCSYNLVYCSHTSEGYTSDCIEYYEEVNGEYSESEEECM